jgi:hypothetical protein
MDQQLAEYFFKEASKQFAFLVKQYSFAAPGLEVDNRFNLATVTFMGKNLAVECMLEEREGDIECKVARVFDGKKTSYYAVDENGVRVREGLSSLLRRKGVQENLFRRVTGLLPRERINIILEDYAQMFKKYGHDILSDSPTALA